MGYVPPPSGIITLPGNVTFTPVEINRIRTAWEHPRLVVLGPPTVFIRPSDARSFTERNVVAFGYGLLASAGALVVAIAWLVVA